MAVPSTNVGMSNIQTEFGGSNPISLSEYYRGGPLVPTSSPAPNGPIPTSGQIAMGQFRGAVKAEFVFANGGTVVNSGNYRIHTFNNPGTFTVTNAGNSGGSNKVGYQVVAGGGGGGTKRGGGGGAGGYREGKTPGYTASPAATSTLVPVSVTSYPITVGGGGSGQVGTNPTGGLNPGSPSRFGPITSNGGGAAGRSIPGGRPGSAGGSGGGATSKEGNSGSGGTGNRPSRSPPQGRNGGAAPSFGGGGGGGAVQNGGNAPGGYGGDGTPSAIRGPNQAMAGGGGGGNSGSGGSSPGGTGGGGNGGFGNGSANTGGGGGGANDTQNNNAGAGGKGRVVIRYIRQ